MKIESLKGSLSSWPVNLKRLIIAFVLILNVGFFTGFSFVGETTSFNSRGIEENYLGNEEDENAEVMLFKKSKREILTLVHNHILSLSVIFFVLALLMYISEVPDIWRSLLMWEPFMSLLFTFGGIYVLWSGVTWFAYVIMVSGTALVVSILGMSYFILRSCLIRIPNQNMS